MSVLVKGMEMPTNCRDCPLKMNCDDCEGWECVCVPSHHQIGYLDELLSDKRRDDCPLIEIPPHGRLIDAERLYKKTKRECNPYGNPTISFDQGNMLMALLITAPTVIEAEPCNDLAKPNNAPTIIPADGGET